MGAVETEAILRDKASKHPELGLDVEAILTRAVDSGSLGDRILSNFVREVTAAGRNV